MPKQGKTKFYDYLQFAILMVSTSQVFLEINNYAFSEMTCETFLELFRTTKLFGKMTDFIRSLVYVYTILLWWQVEEYVF